MVMERGVIRCIDDLNGMGWMISGWESRGRGIGRQVAGYTSGHVAMMISTVILERERREEKIQYPAPNIKNNPTIITSSCFLYWYFMYAKNWNM